MNPLKKFGSKLLGPSDPKALPSDFYSPLYRPCGMPRIAAPDSALAEVNTILLVDDSFSMVMEKFIQYCGALHWDLLMGILPVFADALIQNDGDGIDMYFLNHISNEPGDLDDGVADSGYTNIRNPKFIMDVMKKVRPKKPIGTPTGRRLEYILAPYLIRCADKTKPRPRPINIIALTDGQSDTDYPLKQVIINTMRELTRLKMIKGQVGLMFFQVGNIPGVSNYLKMLDDDLKQYGDDITDTVRFEDMVNDGGLTAETILRISKGSFCKRIDNDDNKGKPTGTSETGDADLDEL